jgi:putative phage-type endonuclease
MIVYKNIEQGSPEWHNLRLGKVTASKLKDLMAADNLSLIDRLIAEIVSEQKEDGYVTAEMQRGTDMEPLARVAYEEERGVKVELVGFIQPDNYEWFGVSPDGLISVNGKYSKAIEIKCPKTQTHVKYIRQGGIPNEYYYQTLSYFIANEDLESLDFISFDNRFVLKPLHIVTISRDELKEDIEKAHEAMDKFWKKFMKYYQQLTF